jgi:hypothetical protein
MWRVTRNEKGGAKEQNGRRITQLTRLQRLKLALDLEGEVLGRGKAAGDARVHFL